MATNFNALVARTEKRVERTKGKKTPYVLSGLPDDMPDIVIEYPDAIRSMNFEKATTVWDQLSVLTGKDFARILGLVEGKDIAVVQDLINDMWDHWDRGDKGTTGADLHSVPGGKED